jgi:hypothetical protein
MAATLLRSERAVAMSVYVVRAFVRMREELLTNAVIFKRLAQIDKKLLEHDVVLRDVVEKLLPLLTPPPKRRSSNSDPAVSIREIRVIRGQNGSRKEGHGNGVHSLTLAATRSGSLERRKDRSARMARMGVHSLTLAATKNRSDPAPFHWRAPRQPSLKLRLGRPSAPGACRTSSSMLLNKRRCRLRQKVSLLPIA